MIRWLSLFLISDKSLLFVVLLIAMCYCCFASRDRVTRRPLRCAPIKTGWDRSSCRGFIHKHRAGSSSLSPPDGNTVAITSRNQRRSTRGSCTVQRDPTRNGVGPPIIVLFPYHRTIFEYINFFSLLQRQYTNAISCLLSVLH